MYKRTNRRIFARAKQLQRTICVAEAKLWKHLRAHWMGDVHFRNHTCPGGRCQGHAISNYIVDFCTPRKKLIIELDGSQHLKQEEYDTKRTALFASKGYRVLRFWKNDVLADTDAVLRIIWSTLLERDITEA